MIAVFARQNQPIGFAYGTDGYVGSHGFVTIGVRCRTRKQVEEVVQHILLHGCDLPDVGRQIYPKGMPERGHDRRVRMYEKDDRPVARWYSGGPGDWDYLFTVSGNRIEAAKGDQWRNPSHCSLGDNRFTAIYDAKEVLAPTQFNEHGYIVRG